MIDSYFSKNYNQGERLYVPEECYKDGIKWKNGRLRELGFYNRIYHRKRDRIEQPVDYRPRVNLRERNRPNNSDVNLDPGHLEFKIWLQHRVELAAAGKGSPRMLQGFKGSTDDKRTAMDKWEELSRKIHEELNKRLLNTNVLMRRGGKYDTRAPIRALFVMEKADRHVRRYGHGMRITAESEDLKDFLSEIMDPEDSTRESFGPIVSLCREVVYALFSNCRTKRPTDLEVFGSRQISQLRKFSEENEIAVSDDMEKEQIVKKLGEEQITPPGDWGWVKISLTSQDFLLTLSDRIADHDHMGKWIRTVQDLSKQDIRDLDLDDEEKIEEKHLRNKGYFGRRGGKADYAVKTQKDRDEKTLHNAKRLSYSILTELVRLGILKKKTMNHEEYLEHSPEGRADKPVDGAYSSILIFETNLTDWTTQSDYASFRSRREHAIYRWLGSEGDRYMYAPPQDHDLTPAKKEPRPGGFLRKKNRKLIGGGHRDYEYFNTPRCRVSELAVDALNTLQKVQWEVNLDFLLKVFDLRLAHHETEVLDWTEIKKRITRVDCKGWARDAFYGEDEAKNKERDIALMWSRKIIDHNANVFWHSWACDFRGRLFPRGTGLSPQGDDLDRAMIRFKHWKPLDEEGRKWLFVHVHNMVAGLQWDEWGKDQPLKRQSFEHRDEWVSDNIESLISLAHSPRDHREILGLNEHSGTGSKTFQRLAALIELRRVWLKCKDNGGDWSKVTSGQPIYLDASCNGYQHVSTLLRNRELASHVNVVTWEDDPANVTGDLYQAVADEARRPSSPAAVSARSKLLSKLRELMPDDKSSRAKVMDLLCTRDIAKPGTLTRMYGKDSTRDCFMGRRGKGKPGWFSSIKFEDGSYGCPKPECDYTHEKEQYVRSHTKKKHHMRSCWHPESPLHLALLKPPVHPALEQKQYHTDLATKVDNLFAAADHAVTGGAYRLYKDSVQSIARLATKTRKLRNIKTATLQKKDPHAGKYMFHGKLYSKTVRLPEWEHAARWELPDKFKVINYYIKHAEASEGHQKNPTHAASLYKHILPEWYDLTKVRDSTLDRLEELGVPDLDRFRASAGRNYSKKLIEYIRKIATDKGGDSNLEEVLDTLSQDSIHLPRYEEDEDGRVWIAKPITSIAPNLIHSLDAFHMRTTIAELHKSDRNLDFWAVHDAFGTHACDVPAMYAKIRKGFASLHHARDINWWLRKMTRDQMHESVYLQRPSKDRPHVFKAQLISHSEKNGIKHATVESSATRDKHYSGMEKTQLHEVVYRRRLKGEIMEHTEKGGIDLESVEPTAKRGGVPTKEDYIRVLVKEQIFPPRDWFPVPNPNRSDYVDRLLDEGIPPPQKWVAWIDPKEFDKRLTFDVRGSVYLVD
ncbi:MAG: hypothetical protein OSB36_02510 [Longimicrobiales bacterium]|nr:hypothetical protein [Longimicrobiales bacterium]